MNNVSYDLYWIHPNEIVWFLEKDAAYVNLSGPPLDQFEMNSGESITWKIEIDAYPDPVITWSKDGNEDIIKQHSKYTVESDRKRTVLDIRDLKLRDTGVYQVEVVAKDIIRTLNYTLRVLGMHYEIHYLPPSGLLC